MNEENKTFQNSDTGIEVVDIQFRPGQKIYYFSPQGISCKIGDHVIIDTARGLEYGLCTGGNHYVHPTEVVAPLRSVLRLATENDDKIAADNQEKEKQVFGACLQKIQEHNLEMQLVSAECAFDGSKIIFFFTADERVDFRELVKDLANALHTRIELRQIGVRDKAKMVGGLGICGRTFCCTSFLDDFQPVSIKMAKTQSLSLNPTKISGTCGRLMCCLKYEQDAYEDLLRNSPKIDSFVDTPEGRGTILEVNLLCERVKVRMEKQPEVVNIYSNKDIVLLRSGKAKKSEQLTSSEVSSVLATQEKLLKERNESVVLEFIKAGNDTENINRKNDSVITTIQKGKDVFIRKQKVNICQEVNRSLSETPENTQAKKNTRRKNNYWRKNKKD